MNNINVYLEDLEARISDEQETELKQEWEAFADNKIAEGYFKPVRKSENLPRIEWPRIMINDALEDYEKMALSQLKACSDILACGGGKLLSVRANYGTGIIPTMFGAPLYIMPYETDTLPCTKKLEKTENLLESGIPDLKQGLCGKVFEFGEYFKELIENYPMIKKHVHVYAPDLQGPLPITESLLGTDMYLDLYDEPEKIEAIMELATNTFIMVLKKWLSYFPLYGENKSIDWGMLHKGNVLIRNDAAMNISGDCYEEFVQPFDQKIFDVFGGGAIHFCGKGDHYIDRLANLKNICAINMSQPDWNNMDIIYRNTVDKGIQIFGMQPEECIRAANAGIDLRGKVVMDV